MSPTETLDMKVPFPPPACCSGSISRPPAAQYPLTRTRPCCVTANLAVKQRTASKTNMKQYWQVNLVAHFTNVKGLSINSCVMKCIIICIMNLGRHRLFALLCATSLLRFVIFCEVYGGVLLVELPWHSILRLCGASAALQGKDRMATAQGKPWTAWPLAQCIYSKPSKSSRCTRCSFLVGWENEVLYLLKLCRPVGFLYRSSALTSGTPTVCDQHVTSRNALTRTHGVWKIQEALRCTEAIWPEALENMIQRFARPSAALKTTPCHPTSQNNFRLPIESTF